jgi:myo-inositol-1(or 4)-monophosphatase
MDNPMKSNELKTVLQFCETQVRLVGEKLLALQSDVSKYSFKDNVDIQLAQDILAEEIYIKEITSAYPSHNIYSEEIGDLNKKSDYQWIIDPIDGTKEYAKELSEWNTNITLQHLGKPIVSAIYLPATKHLYSADMTNSYHNGTALPPPKSKKLIDSVIYCYLPNNKTSRLLSKQSWLFLHKLSYQCYRIRGSVQETVDLAKVASSQHDAQISIGQFPAWYDFVAGFLIAKNAGVKITNLHGDPITQDNNSTGYIAAPRQLHSEIMTIIKKYMEVL